MLLLLAACSLFPEPEYYDTGFSEDCTPDVAFDETGWDFGVQPAGAEAWDSIQYESIGCRDLVVKDAWSDLDSVEVTFDSEPLPPGGFADLHVVWQNPEHDGEFGRVYVQTNARELPYELTFRVEAE